MKSCVRCIMNDEVDKEISFDDSGLCNHCVRYDTLKAVRLVDVDKREKMLHELVKNIKDAGKSSEYDCIVGVSGGVDSTYVAYLVKKLGLRPLAVHFDNGWNSELAVQNIQNVLQKLDIDLITYVIDWPEFRSLQRAFLKAGTPDGEIPTDHAIFALLWNKASKFNIRYIISGMNFVTESMSVKSWSYGHSDWKYIKGVNKRFGETRLKHYPHFSLFYLAYITLVRRVKSVSILNYVDYNKEEVKRVLTQELGWRDYGGKHYESVYTRFYQGYVLPKKFGIDKRYGHLSDLINAGQLSRSEALVEVSSPPYDSTLASDDRIFACKKLKFTDDEFEEILRAEPRSYNEYPNSYSLVSNIKILVNWLRMKGFYPK